jgi:hypothetical protein
MSRTPAAKLTRLLNGIGPQSEIDLARQDFRNRLEMFVDDMENLEANKKASAANIEKLKNGDVYNFILKREKR